MPKNRRLKQAAVFLMYKNLFENYFEMRGVAHINDLIHLDKKITNLARMLHNI